MPKFSQESFSKLSSAHIDLQAIFYEAIKYVDCQVLEGHRGQPEQDAAFAAGTSKLKWPNGKHNALPSHAVDVAPWPIDWKNINRFYWFAGIVMGISEMLFAQGKTSHRAIFGGDWNRDYDITDEKGLKDLVHYQLKI